MRIFVHTATYELRVSRKSHLRDHPGGGGVWGHRIRKNAGYKKDDFESRRCCLQVRSGSSLLDPWAQLQLTELKNLAGGGGAEPQAKII